MPKSSICDKACSKETNQAVLLLERSHMAVRSTYHLLQQTGTSRGVAAEAVTEFLFLDMAIGNTTVSRLNSAASAKRRNGQPLGPVATG